MPEPVVAREAGLLDGRAVDDVVQLIVIPYFVQVYAGGGTSDVSLRSSPLARL